MSTTQITDAQLAELAELYAKAEDLTSNWSERTGVRMTLDSRLRFHLPALLDEIKAGREKRREAQAEAAEIPNHGQALDRVNGSDLWDDTK